MAKSQIKLHYKNVMADVIGDEHGITTAQFDALAEHTLPLIAQINNERTAGKTPYRDLPYKTETAENVRELVAEIKEGCEVFVVLGIGGSALGNIALQTALNPSMYNLDGTQRRGPRLFVFDNVDPAQFASFLDWVEDKLDNTMFNVISKSGRTAETASQFMIVRQLLMDRLGPEGLRDHVVATTDADKGTLRTIAMDANLRCLEVPDGVGGRFSVLSAVGLLSAAMCGIDIDGLLAGARDMDARVSRESFRENPAALNAAIHYHFYTHGKRNSVIMPYSCALKDMADWYRQLWAESLGKRFDLKGSEVCVGPTPIKALGATDQHSQVQLYREGPNDKLFTFLQVDHHGQQLKIGPAPDCAAELGYLAGKDLGSLLNNEKRGTEYALLRDKRPCLTVLFDRVSAHTVGQFIYFFEVTTSLAGALFGINPYDQPAVELGKEATFALMGKEGNYKDDYTYAQFANDIRAETNVDENFLV
ncbi:MAG: glucose-6-phosphate isomerase [Phycisphaerales bacterium]|nr:MAG: glucose-6-phosphate isomerase [Phycisphaerales bacterium]